MTVLGTNLYVGGQFSSAGVSNTSGIARWDGAAWHAVGGGINGTVYALATDGTNLYAGGNFESAGGVSATNIARWDGTNWSSLGALFLPNGLNPWYAKVSSLLWDQELYASGMFTQAGSTSATNVARWDGQSWHALGDGLGLFGPGDDVFQVFCLAKHQNELYAGGLFHRSGVAGVTNLARWTGTNWAQVGGGVRGGSFGVFWFEEGEGYTLSGAVYTLQSSDSGLLVGGDFTEVGGTYATNIALWNGTNWSAIGGSCNGFVYRIRGVDSNQAVAGDFTTIGGVQASGVARWNGSNWENLGEGVAGPVLALADQGTNLFVGGEFQVAGGQAAGHIARWNGSDWEAFLAGDCTAPSDVVTELAVDGEGQLYALGGFVTAGKTRVNRVARYDGENWHALGNGFPEGNAAHLAVVGTTPFVSGSFSRPAEGITNLAQWNGGNWVAVGTGLGNDGGRPYISGLAAGESKLYVTGLFTSAGENPTTNLACWDGTQWSGLPAPDFGLCGSGLMFSATKGDALFLCQQSSCSFGEPLQAQVKCWDGTQWTNVGPSFALVSLGGNYPTINSLVWAGTNLIVGGYFVVTNEFTATNMAKWDGTSWSGVSHPFGEATRVAAMGFNGTNLFAVISPYGVPHTETRLAKWSGADWQVLGTGITGSPFSPRVEALAVRGRDIFLGGLFSTAGGKPANFLALWRDFPEVTLSARGWLSGGEFGLRIHGGKGQLVRVQSSTNLFHWVDLGNQLPTSDSFDFSDAPAEPDRNYFYRLLLVP